MSRPRGSAEAVRAAAGARREGAGAVAAGDAGSAPADGSVATGRAEDRAGGRPAPPVPEVRAAILAWYDAHHRDLPWRRTRDPYAILVSEVMLQQTQVARVVPRWEAWVDRWPDAAALAAAAQPEVLAAWVGLGYNARAVRLRAACAHVAREGWPTTAAGLRALPGVGLYTAAAVASFAFGEPVAAVDTNVRRLAARLGAPPEAWVPTDGEEAARWNQAAMELGAVRCRARRADCDGCPAERWCVSAHRVVVAARAPAGEGRAPFRSTDRWARGRVVRALAREGALPADVEPERLERALSGLVRDGLVEDGPHGPVLATGA